MNKKSNFYLFNSTDLIISGFNTREEAAHFAKEHNIFLSKDHENSSWDIESQKSLDAQMNNWIWVAMLATNKNLELPTLQIKEEWVQ